MIKNMIFTMVLFLIWSNTVFSQCEKYIFSMDEESDFNSQTILEDICAADTDLEWEIVDSLSKISYTEGYEYFRRIVQYYTHFSNVLDNFVMRKSATVSLKDEKTGKILTAEILSIAFYYEYQCDSLISTFNKYGISWYGTATEYVGPIKVLKIGRTILIFLDVSELEKEELEKIYLVCKKALEED